MTAERLVSKGYTNAEKTLSSRSHVKDEPDYHSS